MAEDGHWCYLLLIGLFSCLGSTVTSSDNGRDAHILNIREYLNKATKDNKRLNQNLPIWAHLVKRTGLRAGKHKANTERSSDPYSYGEPICDNMDGRCYGWAQENECTNNPSYMLRNCPRACNTCCENTHNDEECNRWEQQGECNANYYWMTNNCRMACGRCLTRRNIRSITDYIKKYRVTSSN